jgi:hypothetical protein
MKGKIIKTDRRIKLPYKKKLMADDLSFCMLASPEVNKFGIGLI